MNRLSLVIALTATLALSCTSSTEETTPAVTAEQAQHPDIGLGADKDNVLAKYGTPQAFSIQHGSRLTRVPLDRDGIRRLRKRQPEGEGWYWLYEHFVVAISDGKVLHVEQVDKPQTSDSPPGTGATTVPPP